MRISLAPLLAPGRFWPIISAFAFLCGCEAAEKIQLVDLMADAHVAQTDLGQTEALDSQMHSDASGLLDGDVVSDSSVCGDAGSPCAPEMGGCQDDDECSTSQTCVDGRCIAIDGLCQSALDCGDVDTCYQGVCEPLRPSQCGAEPQCQGRAQCGTAVGCTADASCLGTYGASCVSQCDCSGQLICQNSTGVCLECLNGGQCTDENEVCTSAGLCAPSLPVTLPVDETTSRELISILLSCLDASISGRSTIGCAQLTSAATPTDDLRIDPQFRDVLCSHPDVSENDDDRLSRVLGCNGRPSNLIWEHTLTLENGVLGCIGYLPYLPQSTDTPSNWGLYIGPCELMISSGNAP